MSKISGIYAIICLSTGKYYIGSTNNFERRKSEHLKFLRRYSHANIHLQRCFNKYSEKKLVFILIENFPNSDLKSKEQEYLNQAKLNKKLSMNLSFNANRPEWTTKMKNKLSQKKIGIPRPEFIGKNNPFFGKKHNLSTRYKMSVSSSNRPRNYLFQPVRQIDKNTNKIIKIWPSINHAIKSFGYIRDSGISGVCNERNKTSYGFKWEYA